MIAINDFENNSPTDIFNAFNCSHADISFVKEILYADYTHECWSGDSHVLFVGTDGKFYEVFGSHCSCYGLEDQWNPEETSIEYYEAVKERDGNNSKIADLLIQLMREVEPDI